MNFFTQIGQSSQRLHEDGAGGRNFHAGHEETEAGGCSLSRIFTHF